MYVKVRYVEGFVQTQIIYTTKFGTMINSNHKQRNRNEMEIPVPVKRINQYVGHIK